MVNRLCVCKVIFYNYLLRFVFLIIYSGGLNKINCIGTLYLLMNKRGTYIMHNIFINFLKKLKHSVFSAQKDVFLITFASSVGISQKNLS